MEKSGGEGWRRVVGEGGAIITVTIQYNLIILINGNEDLSFLTLGFSTIIKFVLRIKKTIFFH